MVYNYVGPLYGQPLKVGQRAVLLISTYSDGSHRCTSMTGRWVWR